MSGMDDLSSEQIEQIEKRMQKGALSETGFLQPGEHLRDIIERDALTLKKLGITHKQIGDRLESIVGKAERLEQLAQRGQAGVEQELQGERSGPINTPYVENLYRVSQVGYFGNQDCPFICPDGKACPEWTSYDYSIEKVGGGAKLSFSGLIMHLAREHHFFEGSVQYRLDPEAAVRLLDIQPAHDYSPNRATERIWRREQGTTQNYAELERSEKFAYQTAIDAAEEVVKLTDKTCLYLWNGICVSVSDVDYFLSSELLVADAYWAEPKIERGVWAYKPANNTYVEI